MQDKLKFLFMRRMTRIVIFSFIFYGGMERLGAEETISLSEALRLAMAENPGVAAAIKNEAAAVHRVGDARSGLFPAVAASAGYTRYDEPMTVTPLHIVGQFPPMDDQIYETGITLTLPLLNGRTLANIDSAKSVVAEASAQRSLSQLELMRRIAEIYIADRELEDNARLLDAHIRALRQRKQELNSLYTEGRVSPAEISLLEASIDMADSDRLDLENRERELAANLGRILGKRGPVRPKLVDLNEAAFAFGAESENPDGSGPGTLQARARFDGAKYGKSATIRSLWPELNSFAAYSWRSGADMDFNGEWALGLSLRVPLFDVARRWSAIQAADAGLDAARQRYREAQIAEQSLGEIYLAKQKSLRDRRELLSRAVGSKSSSVTAFRERYSEGRLSLSELLTQEAELLQLGLQERSLVYQRASAFIDYHGLKGSLTPSLIESLLED